MNFKILCGFDKNSIKEWREYDLGYFDNTSLNS